MLVRVSNPEFLRQDVWFFTQPEYFEYQGDEVQLKWVGEHELALTTGNPEWPVRVIQRDRIISIDGRTVAQPASSKTLQKVVRGSKGDEYIVTKSGGRITCTCTGFQFRKNCKHTQELA